MKKLAALFLAAVLLLCSGCASGFIPAPPKLPGQTEAPTAAATKVPDTKAPPETEPPTVASDTQGVPASTEPETEPVPETTTVPVTTEPPVDPWSLLKELSFVQGSYEDHDGNSWTYSYDLPLLDADTTDARRINADIDRVFGEQIRSSLEYIEREESIGLLDVGFRGEVWDDILTIVVIAHMDWSFDDYRVYCYDCRSDRWLDTPALLERLGIDKEDFLEICRSLFIDVYKEQYSEIPEDMRSQYGYYDGLARADDDKYVNLDLMVFPDSSGDLKVIAPIVSLAGADYYFQELYLYTDGGNG